jgi:hypothetical protein
MEMTYATSPAGLLLDSRGELLRCRTNSATAIHTPKPEDPQHTMCGGWVRLNSEFACDGADGSYRDWDNDPQRGRTVQGCPEHGMEVGLHQVDMTMCAGDDPQLCVRCEASLAKRQRDAR